MRAVGNVFQNMDRQHLSGGRFHPRNWTAQNSLFHLRLTPPTPVRSFSVPYTSMFTSHTPFAFSVVTFYPHCSVFICVLSYGLSA